MNNYTTQILEDGERNFIVKQTGVLDSSDQPMTTIFSPASCGQFKPKNFRIDHIDFTISDGIELQLWWEGTPDQIVLPMAGRNKFNYPDVGGLQNNASSPTGGVRVKTTGYVTGTQVYSLLIWCVKIGV
jgi:hypothetical protein